MKVFLIAAFLVIAAFVSTGQAQSVKIKINTGWNNAKPLVITPNSPTIFYGPGNSTGSSVIFSSGGASGSVSNTSTSGSSSVSVSSSSSSSGSTVTTCVNGVCTTTSKP